MIDMRYSPKTTGLQIVSLKNTDLDVPSRAVTSVATFVPALVLTLLWLVLCVGNATASTVAQGADEGFSVRLADPVLKLGD